MRKVVLLGLILAGLALAMTGVVFMAGGLDRLMLATAARLQHWSGAVTSSTGDGAQPSSPISYEDRLRQRLGLDWTILAGRWRLDDGVITYLGPDDGDGHGLIISRERLWNGALEAVVRISGGPTAQAQIAFSHNPVTRAYFAAGIGDTHAYALQSFAEAPQLIQVFGQRGDIDGGTDYRLRLGLDGDQYALSVNDVKVISGALPAPPFSDRVGLYVTGDGPISFQSFQVEAREPP